MQKKKKLIAIIISKIVSFMILKFFISIDNKNKYGMHCKNEISNKTILIIIIISWSLGALIIMAIIIGIICKKGL